MQPLLSYNTNLYIAVTCGAIMKCLPCHIDIFFMQVSSDICSVCNVMDFNILFQAVLGNKLC